MAEEKHPTRHGGAHDVDVPETDLQAFFGHVRENPLVYAGAIGFVVLVLLVTLIYGVAQESARQSAASAYLEATEPEDPSERVARLGEVAGSGTYLDARALYLQGETAIDARDYDTAREALTRLRETYPGFEFLPDAVEALGFIEEEQDRYTQARTFYEEVEEKWPESPAAQRQPFNIGRSYESEDDIEAAVEAYRRQLEVFPGSTVALRAQQRLNALRETHPDLFEEESVTTAPLEITDDPLETPEAADALEEFTVETPPATDTTDGDDTLPLDVDVEVDPDKQP